MTNLLVHKKKNSKESLEGNKFHQICRLSDALPIFPCKTTETIGDYYLQTWDTRVASWVAEQLNT